MALNQFFPFATGAEALVLTNSQLQAMTALATGFQQGVADPASVNSVWRQSASIAAMIAQFTADNQPNAVLDNGNIATLEAEFEAALEAYILSLDLYIPQVQTTNFNVNAVTGSDGNDGQAAIAGGGHGPWATVAHAVSFLSNAYAALGAITINVAAGNYNGFDINPSFIQSWSFVGAGAATTFFNAGTLAKNNGFSCSVTGTNVSFSGVTFSAVNSGVFVATSTVSIANCNFVGGSGTTATAVTSSGGAVVSLYGAIGVSGYFSGVFTAQDGGALNLGLAVGSVSDPVTVTFGATSVTYGTVWSAGAGSVVLYPSEITWAGTMVTGPRFDITSFGNINTFGSGVNYIPGNAPGTISYQSLESGTGAAYTGIYL